MTTTEEPSAVSGEEGKAEIVLCNGDLPDAVEAIEAVLVERDPEICQSGGAIYVRRLGGPVKATAALLRIRAMRVASFSKTILRPPDCRPIDPPLKYFEALLRKGEWKFPPLDEGASKADR